MALKKVILKDNPTINAAGQYNYDDEEGVFTGRELTATSTEELYSVVRNSDINSTMINSFPTFWPYEGMQIIIERVRTKKDKFNTTGCWYDFGGGSNCEEMVNILLDINFYDDAQNNVPSPTGGMLPGWNSQLGGDDRHRIFRKRGYWGAESGVDTNDAYLDFFDLNLTIENFPYKTETRTYDSNQIGTYDYHVTGGTSAETPSDQSTLDTNVIDSNPLDWSDYVTGYREGNFVIITKCGSAYEAFEDWFGLISTTPYLTRDNVFQYFYIPKELFYDLITNPTHEGVDPDYDGPREFVIQFGNADYDGDVDLQIDDQGCTNVNGNGVCPIDSAHDSAGHDWPGHWLHGMVVRLVPPNGSERTFRHAQGSAYEFAAYPFESYRYLLGDDITDNYAIPSQLHTLSPKSILYDVDLLNYGYETAADIPDFRPISNVTIEFEGLGVCSEDYITSCREDSDCVLECVNTYTVDMRVNDNIIHDTGDDACASNGHRCIGIEYDNEEDGYIPSSHFCSPAFWENLSASNDYNYRSICQVVQPFDLQSFYYSDFEKFITSTPVQVSLRFDIAENELDFNPNYIDYSSIPFASSETTFYNYSWGLSGTDYSGIYNWIPPDDLLEIGYMGVVTNWNWTDENPIDLDELVSREWPSTLADAQSKFLYNGTYEFIDLADEKSFTHTYQNPGVKTIQAVVFSYTHDPEASLMDDEEQSDMKAIGSLRWKEIKIKINLTLDPIFAEEFTEVGGVDYNFIPYPYRTPIIGGISENSTYYNNINNIVLENRFKVDEYFDKQLTLNAVNNDELGKHVGKIDIAQTRLFMSGVYNMNDLLMITAVDDSGIFTPYYDDDYWDGIINSFPEESCVGTIFINDSNNSDLKSKCIVELNATEITGNTILDSSGNGNIGVMIGDYSINKPDKGVPVTRESVSNFSEQTIDRESGAF